MNADQFRKAEALFFELRDLPPARRNEALQSACAGDEALRREVESLLEGDGADPAFLSTPALGASIISGAPLDEEDLSGQRFGKWRLVGRIAAGGMGAVYAAERDDAQFQQRVAVKVVKRGLDTDEVLRRFRSERQTLAGLNHPNIARLLDGGATPDGRPYLVMELVEGEPIGRYSDEHRLGVRARVELFRTVCEAVLAAHQALIVHRDLKPSNILIDSRGSPKLLDFGIAKVLDSPGGTSSATVTRDSERRLTPEYASPEQVRGDPIGTASDVYSLGIVLYELLAGARPFDFSAAARAEIERTVCFVAPELPSRTAERAGGEHARRAPALRGDLDTIILMAMRKEPARRYPTVDALIADLDRYLHGRPVAARPDTTAYRFAKFITRNPVLSGLSMALVLALLGGIAATTWQARRATLQRNEAFRTRDESEGVSEFLRSALRAADPTNEGPEARVISFVNAAALSARERFKERPLVLATVLDTIGRAYTSMGELSRGEPLITEALQTRERLLAANHHDLGESLVSMGELRYAQRRLDEAMQCLNRARSIFEALGEQTREDLAETWNDIGVVHRAARRQKEAVEAHMTALSIREALHGRNSLPVAESLNNLASARLDAREFDAASDLIEESLHIRQSLLPSEHPMVVQSMTNLAALRGIRARAALAGRKPTEARDPGEDRARGDLARAEELLRQAIELGPRAFGDDAVAQAVNLNALGTTMFLQERWSDAIEPLREAVRIRTKRLGATHRQTLNSRLTLARSLLRMGPPDEKEGGDVLASTLEALLSPAGELDPGLRQAAEELMSFLRRSGRDEEAQVWARRLSPP
ncbi:MAG: tetratricopeptide repeat protein [Phycisphaerales bacterium]